MKTDLTKSAICCVFACLLAIAHAFGQESGQVSLRITLHPIQTIDIRPYAAAGPDTSDAAFFDAHASHGAVARVVAFGVAETGIHGPGSPMAGASAAMRPAGDQAVESEARHLAGPLATFGSEAVFGALQGEAGEPRPADAGPAAPPVFLYSILAR